MNEFMNDKGIFRTAPATPGLLNRNDKKKEKEQRKEGKKCKEKEKDFF